MSDRSSNHSTTTPDDATVIEMAPAAVPPESTILTGKKLAIVFVAM